MKWAPLFILLCAPLLAQAPPIRVPDTPSPPPVPAPKPPDPTAVSRLTADMLYVVDADVEVIVLSSPAGLLKVTPEQGPMRIRARFVDGLDRVEMRAYKGKYLYLIEAAGTGRVELLLMPTGLVSEKDIIRRTLDVDDGTAPRPPPVPPVPVPPTPVPPTPVPPPVPVSGFRVLLVHETSANTSKEHLNVLNSTAVVDYLNRKTVKDAKGRPEWRKWDRDMRAEDMAKESDIWKAIWAAAKPMLGALPAVVIFSDQKGESFPLPTTEAAMLELIKRYGGE